MSVIQAVKQYVNDSICIDEMKIREYISLLGYPANNVKTIMFEVAKDKRYKLYNIQNYFIVCNYSKMLNRYEL